MTDELFTAIDIGKEARNALIDVQKRLLQNMGPAEIRDQMEDPLDFHITLRYLGTKLNEKDVVTRLKKVRFLPFELETAALGMFLNTNFPVIWSGVQGDIEKLRVLQADVDHVLDIHDRIGYTPHITLAYFHYPIASLQKAVSSVPVQIPVKSFELYRILKSEAAPKFEKIHEFPAAEMEETK